MRIIGIILLTLFIFVGHVSAMDISLNQKKMSNNIKESLRDHPELWIIKSSQLFYYSDIKMAKKASESSFPGVCDGIDMEIMFSVYQVDFVHIETPFKMEFDDNAEEMMVTEIKIFLYKYFKDQVGDLVEKEEQTIPEKFVELPEMAPVKQVVYEDGMKGL